MKGLVSLLMYVIELLISILTDFVASHKIVFYSKLYDIDFLVNFTHDRTYITLYAHEILLSLHQHCFLDNKAPRTTLIVHNLPYNMSRYLYCAVHCMCKLESIV